MSVGKILRAYNKLLKSHIFLIQVSLKEVLVSQSSFTFCVVSSFSMKRTSPKSSCDVQSFTVIFTFHAQ